MKRFFTILLAILCLAGLCSCQKEYQDTVPVTQEEFEKLKEEALKKEQEANSYRRVLIIGDSTATRYRGVVEGAPTADELARNLMGWGPYLPYYFSDKLESINYSFGGASTFLFYSSEQYRTFQKTLKAGDYVLLQLMYNDVMFDDRRTSSGIDYKTVDSTTCQDASGTVSYQGALYYYYIKPILDAGATPVLLTLTVQRSEQTGLAIYPDRYDPYIEDLRYLSEELSIPLIDATETAEALYKSLCDKGGITATEYLHAYTDSTAKKLDNHHFSPEGAYEMAGIYANELVKTVPDLAHLLLETPRPFDKNVY